MTINVKKTSSEAAEVITLTMPFIDDKHIKLCRISQTSNTPPSRKNQAINTGQNTANLR